MHKLNIMTTIFIMKKYLYRAKNFFIKVQKNLLNLNLEIDINEMK